MSFSSQSPTLASFNRLVSASASTALMAVRLLVRWLIAISAPTTSLTSYSGS
uniref:Putative disease resistance protein RGA3 n=1 Tax=Rhizophora mucronata TaxID=61149 RepID=A0A2P2J5B4_RHIMU